MKVISKSVVQVSGTGTSWWTSSISCQQGDQWESDQIKSSGTKNQIERDDSISSISDSVCTRVSVCSVGDKEDVFSSPLFSRKRSCTGPRWIPEREKGFPMAHTPPAPAAAPCNGWPTRVAVAFIMETSSDKVLFGWMSGTLFSSPGPCNIRRCNIVKWHATCKRRLIESDPRCPPTRRSPWAKTDASGRPRFHTHNRH